MKCLLLLLAGLVATDALRPGAWTRPKRPWKMRCKAGESVSGISSFHLRGLRDSLFKFQCKPFGKPEIVGESLVKQPFKVILDDDSGKGLQHFGNPGTGCLEGFALVGFESKYEGKERMLRCVCAKVEEEVDADMGCVLSEVTVAGGKKKRDTTGCPVNPKPECPQMAAWGVQLGKKGKLLIKWCPVKDSEKKEDNECLAVTEEETFVTQVDGANIVIETQDSEKVEVTNMQEIQADSAEFEEEEQKKKEKGATKRTEIMKTKRGRRRREEMALS